MELRDHGRYGYSALPERPDYHWPGGKRLALCICNNIEIFSYRSGLGSDSATLTAPQTHRNYAWRDYGNRVGQWYLFDLLEECGLPASHNVNSAVLRQYPQILQRILSRGDEIVSHGRSNGERQDVLSENEERQLIAEATEEITSLAGYQPKGWMGPYFAQSEVTLDLLQEAGYEFMLDWPVDDQPVWMRTRGGHILSVPYSVELNDSPSMVFRQESIASFECMIIDQFDEMLFQSAKRPLVFSLITHPFIIGHPYRLHALRRALAHILLHRDEIWITTVGGVNAHIRSLPSGILPGAPD
ncbi:polysaccharide deacetylase family protein [Tianweitania sp. BSSL-BM11]|uniref:Chitooligosaccharide deacetylase n=1 Tax=Tianweitania aestuarii TaxID=2814886 RepID=A0ABS5RXU0_9HYPH|nr:polysaccharide deacetylase family protein [Tianweitania aestuarii]MBS9721807.1 polysaccharide deacetylase family protein [Tianweitania aestuarii]